MNFSGSSAGSSNPPPPPAGVYSSSSSNYNNSYNPYSPVYQSSNFGYSPSSWPPQESNPGEEHAHKKDYVYNGYPESDLGPPYRPPSEDNKSEEDPSKPTDLIVPPSVNSGGVDMDNTSSSSPHGSNEDSSSSTPKLSSGLSEEDKKSFRPQDSEQLLSDLSKFDEKTSEILSNNNNNNDDYQHHLGGPDLGKSPSILPYEHQPHHHEDWLPGNQHLQGSAMGQHGFSMGMGAYGQPPQQQPPQQPMWNYYNSYPPQERPFMETPWWNYSHPPQQQQQQPTASLQSWTPLRGPRPNSRSERRGPGRPRLSASNSKGSPGGSPSSPSASPSSRLTPGYPYASPSELSPGEDVSVAEANRKRGPGRPRIGMVDGMEGMPGLDEHGGVPSVPSVPTPTTTSSSGGGKSSKGSSNSTNSNKKRYVCEICQKRFSTAWYVRVHRKSHNGERPYICHNCGKGFMLPNVLQVHLRKCEKTANLRPEAPPQVRPGSANNSHSSGSPLPQQQQTQQQQHVPYPACTPTPATDIYGGLYNQRFQASPVGDSLGYGLLHPGEQGNHLQPHSSNYVSEPSLPGGFPNERSPSSYGSPLFSPSSHHFLANDRPPDKGGGSNSSTSSFPLTCQTCDSLFESHSSREDHFPCPGSFSCSFCDKTNFRDKGDFEAHLSSSHGICPVCSERFPYRPALLSHIQSNHEKFLLENASLAAECGSLHSTGLKESLLLEPQESDGSGSSSNSSSGNPNAGDLSTKHQTPLAMS